MKFYKVKAGSIQFAIMISAVIAVLLSVFIVLIHSHSLFAKKTDLLIEMVQQSETVLLSKLADFSPQKDTVYDVLEQEKGMSSKTHEGYWGMYGKVFAQTNVKSMSFEKIALVSGWQEHRKRTSLYLQETNRPLIVVGNTRIEGRTFLPSRGVRAGTIAGNSYYGNQLIYGAISKSKEVLPKLPQTLIDELASLQKAALPTDDAQYIDISAHKKVSNSFTKPTQMIFERGEIDLFGKTIIGNIIIRSDTKIKVAASTNLKDVILIAPTIEIEDSSKGVFQAIASQQIIVGEDAELNYPSALIVLADDDTEASSDPIDSKNIFIGKNSKIQGIVCYLQDETIHRFEPQILFKENTTLEGFVYTNQQIELLGSIYGSVYAKGFITKQFGSVYQNHIYNAAISSRELMDEFVGVPFDDLNYKVVKWLY